MIDTVTINAIVSILMICLSIILYLKDDNLIVILGHQLWKIMS
jgi:hypothetical protein